MHGERNSWSRARQARGATLVESVIVLGAVALACLGAFNEYGVAVGKKTGCLGDAVVGRAGTCRGAEASLPRANMAVAETKTTAGRASPVFSFLPRGGNSGDEIKRYFRRARFLLAAVRIGKCRRGCWDTGFVCGRSLRLDSSARKTTRMCATTRYSARTLMPWSARTRRGVPNTSVGSRHSLASTCRATLRSPVARARTRV